MKGVVILFGVVGLLGLVSSEYQHQGFESFSQSDQGISFECNGQCFILLGEKGDNEVVEVDSIKGEGQLVVGVLDQNSQLIAIGQQTITSETSEYVVSLSSSQYSIPADTLLGILFVGNVGAESAHFSLTQLLLKQRIRLGWRGFLTNEGQTFYGINLRYGQKLGSTGIVVVGYWVVTIGLVILFWRRKFTLSYIICVIVGVYLLIALRNQIDYTNTTLQGLRSYTFAQNGSKVYGNLGDYYEFVSQARAIIGLEATRGKSCNIYFECTQERPYCAHMESLYMRPCKMIKDINQSDYQMYYKKIPTAPLGTQLLEFHDSFVYKN